MQGISDQVPWLLASARVFTHSIQARDGGKSCHGSLSTSPMGRVKTGKRWSEAGLGRWPPNGTRQKPCVVEMEWNLPLRFGVLCRAHACPLTVPQYAPLWTRRPAIQSGRRWRQSRPNWDSDAEHPQGPSGTWPRRVSSFSAKLPSGGVYNNFDALLYRTTLHSTREERDGYLLVKVIKDLGLVYLVIITFI